MNLTLKHNPKEFNQFLFDKIDLDLYQYKYLKDFIVKAQEGQYDIYDLSVINTTAYGWILIIHSEMLLIYGHNWRTEQFLEISETFDLNKYTNYTLAGEDDLIEELINFYKPKNCQPEKRRLFYKTEKVNVFDTYNLRIELGTLDKLDELALMLQEYYHEEYNGLNDKKIEDMTERMLSMIRSENVYVLLNPDDKILSFCSIVDPDIGILFTKKEYRNKGFGKIILSYCSSILQRRNGTVFLMTDRDKPESNQVCCKVGFEPYFNYKMITINCG